MKKQLFLLFASAILLVACSKGTETPGGGSPPPPPPPKKVFAFGIDSTISDHEVQVGVDAMQASFRLTTPSEGEFTFDKVTSALKETAVSLSISEPKIIISEWAGKTLYTIAVPQLDTSVRYSIINKILPKGEDFKIQIYGAATEETSYRLHMAEFTSTNGVGNPTKLLFGQLITAKK